MIDTVLIDNINIRWKQIFHSLKKSSRPILNALGLTKVDINILLSLNGESKKTKAQLAQCLSFEPNSLTRSLERLVVLGLIKRVVDEHDKRYIRLSLTPAGQKIINQYLKAMHIIWDEALKGLTKKEIKMFNQLLNKIFLNLYSMDAE